MSFCPGCGTEVLGSAEICPNCGTRVNAGKQKELPHRADGELVMGEKSGGLAVVLGLIIIGAGLMYAGRVGLGIAHLILSVVFCWTIIIPLALWIYGMLKAYDLCKENNRLWVEYLNSR